MTRFLPILSRSTLTLPLLLIAGLSHAGDHGDTKEAATVQVTGSATVMAVPDRAELRTAVEIVDSDAQKASTTANRIAESYVDALRDLGTEARHITSSAIRLMPEYRWNKETETRERTGFRAHREVVVRIQAIEKLGSYLGRAASSGMTQINPPSLYAAAADSHRREALTKATANARANAEAVARGLGRELDSIITLDARQGGPSDPRPVMMMRSSAMEDAANPQVETGEIRFDAEVSARYRLKP